MAGQVPRRIEAGREDQPVRGNAAGVRLAPEIALGRRTAIEQPQHALGCFRQEPHPDIEDRWHDLVDGVETAEDEGTVRQAAGVSGRRFSGDRPLAVVDLVAFGKMDEAFRIKRLLGGRNDGGVDENVVHPIGARCSRIAEIARLNRRRAVGEDSRPRIGADPLRRRIAAEIDRDADFGLEHAPRDLRIGKLPDVDEMIDAAAKTLPHRAAVIRTAGKREELEAGAVVALEKLGNQPGGRMVMEVG